MQDWQCINTLIIWNPGFPNWKIPDSNWPGHANKKNIDCFKGTHKKFLVKCPRCKKSYLSDRPEFDKPVKWMSLYCPKCKKRWLQRVAVRGTVLRRLDN